MSRSKKKHKYRANIRDYVDADYKDKLDEEELEWLENFENSYYSNAIGREDSVFRCLPEEEYKAAKKEVYDMSNAQNRDAYGIAGTSTHYLSFLDEEDNFVQLEGDKARVNTLDDPKASMDLLIEEAKDEILSNCGRHLETILRELAYQATKIGYQLRPDRVRKALRKRKSND
tara:strand:+ start:1185 stop:1703 length:519 start_codon:yes stop_codon:yes gene_type:complete